MDRHFHTCLKREAHKALARAHPLPDIPALQCPRMDEVIMDFVGASFPTRTESSLKRIPSSCIWSAASMLNLWIQLEEQGLDSNQGGLVPVEVILDTIQRSLVLIGNASNYISEARRDLVVGRISQKQKGLGKILKNICHRTKPEGSALFGSSVHKALTVRADTLADLYKA